MRKTTDLALIAVVVLMVTLACSIGGIQELILTPSPTTPPTGTSKTSQPDGSVVFTDYDNQYEITFPAAWTTIDLDSDDWNKMMDIVLEKNPGLEGAISSMKNMDSDVFRIFALDLRPEHIVDGNTSTINISVQDNDGSFRLTLQQLVDLNVTSLPQVLPGSTVLDSKVTKSGSGIPIGIIEATMPMTNAIGNQSILYEQVVIIKLTAKVALVTFATSTSLQETLLPEFYRIIDTFKILE